MSKKKDIKPFSTPVAITLIVLAFLLMAAFLVFILTDDKNVEPVSEAESSMPEETSEIVSSGEHKETMAEAEVGDRVAFGEYKGEKVEWIVLEKSEKDILLISQKVLDCKKFNDTRAETDYASSTLKEFLNGEFLSECFTDSELASLTETENGKVFLLSKDEAEKLFASDAYRACAPTDSAEKNGVRKENGNSFWWLRDNGKQKSFALYVDVRGMICDGFAVDTDNIGIRPAIKVSAKTEIAE